MTQHDLENFDTEQKRYGRSPPALSSEVLEDCRQLLQRDPDACLPEMATTLNNLGFMDRIQNRIEETPARTMRRP